MNMEIIISNRKTMEKIPGKTKNQVIVDRMKTINAAVASMRKNRVPEKEVQEAVRKFWAAFRTEKPCS